MSNIKTVFLIFLIVAFLAGIFVSSTDGLMIGLNQDSVQDSVQDQESDQSIDSFDNKLDSVPSCPDLLIKRGNKLMLYNTKLLEVEGVNPLPFDTLDDYIKYMDVQGKNGSQCPVLFMQEENDAQGKNVLRMRPSPFYVEGGLPPLPMKIHDNKVIQNIIDASRENPPYNANNHAGFDPYNHDVGRFSNIDQIHKLTMDAQTDVSGNKMSENPMDSNWGGIAVTQKAVDSGKYIENEVRPVMYPKMPVMVT